MKKRPRRITVGYYHCFDGVTRFAMTPEQSLKWNAFCRSLDRPPTRADFMRFKKQHKL